MQQVINNKKIVNGWAMYDWANSVYSLVITSSIFPIYYNSVTKDAFGGDVVRFFGYEVPNTALYSYALSFSFLLISFLSPILSGIADYSGRKKFFMKFFAYLGSISCMGLYFFEGANIEYGILCSVLASIGFAGSLVFYNAYLPEITTPDRYDQVSARGFSYGYTGSVILMIFNLAMIMKPELFGLKAGGMPARISFLTVGVWWALFSQITFYRLPKDKNEKILQEGILTKGFHELAGVFKKIKKMPDLKTFLLAFFFYNMGVQTVMYLAASFGDSELKLDSSVLIGSILIIQLVAIAGANLFARISKAKGNIFSLSVMIVIWVGVTVGAYFVTDKYGFVSLAFVVGLIMGGIQSMSRSTYTKLLPETDDHASFFSFYDVTEKISIVLGTLAFGLMINLTGSMRNSVLPLMVFFIIGFIVLQFAKNPKLRPVVTE